MNTDQLNEFYVLCASMNYSEAARRLFISQSTLTRHIQAMEEELGVPLFARNTRQLTLTGEGQFLLGQVPKLLRQALDIEALLHSRSLNTEGGVHIIYSSQTMNTDMLNFLTDFQDMYPNVSLKLTPLVQYPDLETLYTCDLLICANDIFAVRDSDTDILLAASQRAYLAVPPRHPMGNLTTIRLTDLEGETLIIPHESDLSGPYARLGFVANKKCDGALGKLRAETVEQAMLMVELSQGVLILPHHLRHQVYPHTRTIPIADADCIFPIYAYYNKTAGNPAAELCFARLEEHFRK